MATKQAVTGIEAKREEMCLLLANCSPSSCHAPAAPAAGAPRRRSSGSLCSLICESNTQHHKSSFPRLFVVRLYAFMQLRSGTSAERSPTEPKRIVSKDSTACALKNKSGFPHLRIFTVRAKGPKPKLSKHGIPQGIVPAINGGKRVFDQILFFFSALASEGSATLCARMSCEGSRTLGSPPTPAGNRQRSAKQGVILNLLDVLQFQAFYTLGHCTKKEENEGHPEPSLVH